MIEKQSIENLKNIINIVEFISNYIELKKSGSNYKAVCPFHNEKTPSLMISPSKQIFHCFGCGVGGDIISFIMNYEKLSYPEAIEKIASTYNIKLNYTKGQEKEESLILDKILKIYINSLKTNEMALSYLKERGVLNEYIEKFQIAYAPSSSFTLNFLQANIFSLKEAEDFGLISKTDKEYYARFSQRLLFPIHNINGKLVGFGGRTLRNHPAKYINSPQSKVFNKSKLLYAYHLAKKNIYEKKEIIVTEGYLDTIMLHQAGFTNSVATLGTALTSGHLPILHKSNSKIILAYDGDQAGKQAALKTAIMLSQASFDGGVVIFKNGLDPADMVKEKRIDELKILFSKPKPFVNFVLEDIINSYDINNPIQKEKILKDGVQFLNTLSPILKEEYGAKFSSYLNINKNLLKLKTNNIVKHLVNYNEQDSELNMIKTLIQNPKYINTVLEYIDTKFFIKYKKEFELVKKEEFDNSLLRKIIIDDKIKAYDKDDFKKSLIAFLKNYYTKKLKEISTSNNLDLKKKIFLIRKTRTQIEKLNNDELVEYEFND